MAGRIVNLLPAHRVYMEPFFGSGAVLFAKQPATHEIINDINGNVVAFFRCLRDRPADLEEACRLTPHARAEYDAADLTGELDDLERARRFWVRVNQSFAKNDGTQTGFSITTSRTQSVPASVAGRLARFRQCALRLMMCTIEQCDAAGLIERLATRDTVIYVDPPYLAVTRRADRVRAADYLHDMGGDDDHRHLADVLHATPAFVILSGYPSPLYDDLYADWWRIDIPTTVQTGTAAHGRGPRTEVLWCSRPPDNDLFAGSDVAHA